MINSSDSTLTFVNSGLLPSRKLTYPPKNGILKMIFPKSRLVGYVKFPGGYYIQWLIWLVESSCKNTASSKVQLIKSLPTQDCYNWPPMFSLPFSLPWLDGWAPYCCEISNNNVDFCWLKLTFAIEQHRKSY